MAKIKMDFKKINLAGVKQFLFAKGEKLVLAVVLVVGVFMVGTGLWGAMSSNGKGLTQNLRDDTNRIKLAMNNDANAAVPPPPTVNTNWPVVESNFPYKQLVPVGDTVPPKRGNPYVVAVLGGPENVKFDFFKGAAIQVYSVERNTEKVEVVVPTKGAAGEKPGANNKAIADKQFQVVETLSPRRMLVVSCFFPMDEQLLEFQNALRLPKNSLAGKDYPQILGVNIMRVEKVLEFDPKTMQYVEKIKEEIPLYLSGKIGDNKFVRNTGVAPHLDDLLRDVHIDEDALKPFANHYVPGTMTLMPKLANAVYPPLDLKRFREVKDEKDPKKDPKGLNPREVGVKDDKAMKKPAREGSLSKVPWADLEPAEADPGVGKQVGLVNNQEANWGAMLRRIRGSYPVFSAQDSFPNKDGNRPQQPVGPMGPKGGMPPMGKFPMGEAPPVGVKPGGEQPLAQYDPLIRFFDVDLEPGHIYEYKVQVRMANPNFGKETEVTIATDADLPELPPSEWKTLPAFRVPPSLDEVNYYAADQWERKPAHPCGPDFDRIDDKMQKVPVQIHRWFGETGVAGDKYVIADWVVAERVLVRRGEYIGRKDLSVPAATWAKIPGDFEVLNPPALATEDPVKKIVVPPAPAGIKLDFAVTEALLVDFEGGPKAPKKAGGFVVNPKVDLEESAIDLLILKPDGKLAVRNSSRDYNLKVRQDIEKGYRDRLQQFTVRPPEGQRNPNDPEMPPKKKKLFGE